MKDIIDLHTHTLASGHAYNTLMEMVRGGAAAGMRVFGSSDHGPAMPGSCHRMYFVNFKAISRHQPGTGLLMGCELNILDYQGKVDLNDDALAKMDYAIASLHIPCCEPGTAAQNTDAFLGAMKNPRIQIIWHPDDSRYPVDYDTLVAAAGEHHKLLEVNNSSLKPGSFRQGAREHYIEMLELCVHYHVSILMGSDAHWVDDAGNHSLAHALLEEIHFPQELVVNTSVDKLIPYIPAAGIFQEAQAGK